MPESQKTGHVPKREAPNQAKRMVQGEARMVHGWLIPLEVHKKIISGLSAELGFDRALSYELDNQGKLHARFGRGIDPRESSYYEGRVSDRDEVFDWALREKKEQIIFDPQDDPRCNPKKIEKHQTKPFAIIPIVRHRKVVMVVSVNNWDSNRPLEEAAVNRFKDLSDDLMVIHNITS